MSEQKCSSCFGTGIDESGYCLSCGEIVDEHQLISAVQFDTAKSMIGRRLSATQTTVWSAGLTGCKTDSVQTTINKGKKEIAKIAAALNISRYVDKAHRIFMVAAKDRFTQGRRREIVCACCLYICCRLERSPLLLIDFADALQVNMFTLGAAFVRLKESINWPDAQRKVLMMQASLCGRCCCVHIFSAT
jgi:transcription factor IIIB subunit 2